VQGLARPITPRQRRDKFPARFVEILVEQSGASVRQGPPIRANPQICRAQQLVLSHRQPAGQLADRFGKSEPSDHRIKRIGALAGFCPFEHHLERGNTRRDPSETVRSALFGVDGLRFKALCERRVRRGLVCAGGLQRLP
jgi:hypothetical protein